MRKLHGLNKKQDEVEKSVELITNRNKRQLVIYGRNAEGELTDSVLFSIDDNTHILTIQSTENFNGVDIPVIFTANDPGELSDEDTTSVSVLPVNDPPVFISDLPVTIFDEDTQLELPLSDWFGVVEDVDNPDSTLTWHIEDNDSVATVISPDTITFTVSPEWFGTDTLTVIITDDGSLSDTASLIVIINPVASFSDTGVVPQETYYYWVTVSDTGGQESAFSEGFMETALPVELTSFKAFVAGDNIQLHWKTATETNSYGFEVERRETTEVRGQT